MRSRPCNWCLGWCSSDKCMVLGLVQKQNSWLDSGSHLVDSKAPNDCKYLGYLAPDKMPEKAVRVGFASCELQNGVFLGDFLQFLYRWWRVTINQVNNKETGARLMQYLVLGPATRHALSLWTLNDSGDTQWWERGEQSWLLDSLSRTCEHGSNCITCHLYVADRRQYQNLADRINMTWWHSGRWKFVSDWPRSAESKSMSSRSSARPAFHQGLFAYEMLSEWRWNARDDSWWDWKIV